MADAALVMSNTASTISTCSLKVTPRPEGLRKEWEVGKGEGEMEEGDGWERGMDGREGEGEEGKGRDGNMHPISMSLSLTQPSIPGDVLQVLEYLHLVRSVCSLLPLELHQLVPFLGNHTHLNLDLLLPK